MVSAHYGGAPEAMTIVLPIVIFSAFMLLERRARRRERERAQELEGGATGRSSSDDGGAVR